MIIHVHKDGTDFGGFTLDELNQQIAVGSIPFYSSLAWHDGLTEWMTLHQVSGIIPPPKDLPVVLAAPPSPPPVPASYPTPPPVSPTGLPPMPGARSLETSAWVIAFVPLAGLILELVSLRPPGSLWLLVFAANVGLCYLDEVELRKAGYETKGMGAISFFIPVYLYKRAELLRQGKAYFVTWIVCFFLSLSV